MKIGILTFHRSHNYGAVLQAFALLSTLKNMGHDAEIIDYWPKYRVGHYSLISLPDKTKKKKSSLSVKALKVYKKISGFPAKYIKYSKFNSFIKNNLKIKTTSFDSGSGISGNYDAIICGSDQIWRYNFRGSGGFDDVYFAKYPQNKNIFKVSYAASMGDEDLDENSIKIFAELIKNFNSISVREDSLLELVKPFATKLPIKVLDPVFLLSEPEWRKMINRNDSNKKYLLFYQLLYSKEAGDLAKKIAKEKQLEIIEISGRWIASSAIGDLKPTVGPVDFISMIAYADYVVSTSYHGVVFSIIFQKQFAALGFKNKSYRIKSLLKSLEIEQCLIENDLAHLTAGIDYACVNKKLEEMIKGSLSFLQQSINKEEYLKKGIMKNDI